MIITETKVNEYGRKSVIAGSHKECVYQMTRHDVEHVCGTLAWSGEFDLPQVGTRVHIKFNSLGTGTVVDYFCEHGYLGVRVHLDDPPAWHRSQHKGTKHEGHAMVFGSEITLL